jgi:hypothetical protein
MANTIKIKRSLVTASPATLAEGELAYSEVSGTLFIGTSGDNIAAIGGTGALGTSFNTISVSGQNDVVADTSSDTLTLIAGTNVTIATNATTDTITISSTDTTYTAGTGITLTAGQFDVDLSELSISVTDADGAFFVVVDSIGDQRRLTKANVNLTGFNNDGGWTSNTGTVTSIAAGNGLDFTTITTSGSITLGTPSTVSDITTNSLSLNSHTHAVAGFVPSSYLDTDVTLAANSDTKVATQKAIKTYTDNIIAAANATIYKGAIDCSTNPDYPAADAGWLYRVSVAGKIGGASGINVQSGDMLICLVDATVSGDQATVGANWNIIQANIDGAVIGPASAQDNFVVFFDGVSGKLVKDNNIQLTGSNTGDVTIPTPKYFTIVDQVITQNTVAAIYGGTGMTSYVIGDILYASSATALSKLADVAVGNVLISGGIGVAPSYGKVGLATHVSGTLGVGNGGTGAVSFTTNGVLYGNSTSALQVTVAGSQWDATYLVGEILSINSSGTPTWTNIIDGGGF